jgi:putative methyltransferase (TIGR04325 family)
LKQLFLDFYFKYWKKYGWFGDYKTWKAAQANCGGYDTEGILEKVVEAARQVKEGKAAFERDSVLFFEKEENKFVVQAVKKATSSILKTQNSKLKTQNTEGVSVLDFGGSLGSAYFQNRSFISNLNKWCIVEQEHFVTLGKKEFEDTILSFELNIEAAYKKNKPQMVLLNSVLQYLETPYEIIKNIEKLPVDYLLIERTPVADIEKDRITKQIVPNYIYKASYPSWIFSEKQLEKTLLKNWQIIESENTPYGLHHAGGKQIGLKNLFLKRIKK